MPFRRKAADEGTGLDPERRSRVKGIFDDLLNLEINAIVTSGMTARKMPAPWIALNDIVGYYTELLVDFSTEIRVALNRHPVVNVLTPNEAGPSIAALHDLSMVDDVGDLRPLSPLALARPPGQASLLVFRQLGMRAQEAWAVGCKLVATETWPDREKVNERVVLLKRIFGNCEQLAGIIAAAGAAEDQPVTQEIALSAEHLITVRKIWEVGVATVVMQTVVQLDGDIVTRIHMGHWAASNSTFQELHRQSVANALQNWQFLGQTLAQFVRSVLKDLL